ncbi:MAG: cache domain-containing protein [Desulfofustis sp.]|nr:cache domain-containing protein [Desulfofustis sp.]
MLSFQEKNIAGISFAWSAVLVVFLTITTGLLFVVAKKKSLDDEVVLLEQEFLEQQREQLKNDVSGVLAGIELRRDISVRQIEEDLRNRVEEVRLMAENLYDHLHGKMSEAEIAVVIREAVRPIRLATDEGYFFIITTAGEAILYPFVDETEDANLLDSRVSSDPGVIEKLIEITKQSGHGFYQYEWPKPGDPSGALYRKISYVTLFQPFGWIIGTGEYEDILEKRAKADLIQELGGSLSTATIDYYFLYELHHLDGGEDFATMLINGNRPDLVGTKISDDYLDARGKPFRKEFMEGIRRDGEAFVVYWYRKPDGSGDGRKLSYFKLFPEWNWILARGIYLDRLDASILEKKEQLRRKVRGDILILGLILLVGIALSLLIAHRLSRGLQGIFDRYRRGQQESLEKLAVLNTALERQSRTDSLTGSFNRRYFNTCLAEETARSGRYATPLSLVLFDIDYFKQINDRIGHLAGDTVLKEICRLVQDNIRQSDLLARWGGEEFVILCPGIDLPAAGRLAEKLRLKIEQYRFSEGGHITCSFGAASFQPPEDLRDFLQRTDQALYQAKGHGRNCCVSDQGGICVPDESAR